MTALETLGVWDACADKAAPLRVMRIVDDTGRLWRAPEVKFDAAEIGQEAFGTNIENRHLVAALDARAEALPALRRVDDQVPEVTPGDERRDGHAQERRERLSAPLVVGADGRRSLCRAAAGIALDEREYPPDGADGVVRPQPAAPRRLDRIPYPHRPLHRGAAQG